MAQEPDPTLHRQANTLSGWLRHVDEANGLASKAKSDGKQKVTSVLGANPRGYLRLRVFRVTLTALRLTCLDLPALLA